MRLILSHLVRLWIACIPAVLLTACAGGPPPLTTTAAVTVVDATELPAPTGTGDMLDERGYRIGVSDRLVIDVFGFQELNARRIQVDGAGQIELPMVGSLSVAGLTPAEVSAQITQRLRAAYVRNPQVAVNIEEALSKVVTVDGQVTQPGNYPVLGEMTLMRSIAAARGVSEFARLDDVVVFRTVNGQRMAALYNLGAIRRGNYPDPAIYAEDVVVVGDSSARRLFRDLLIAAPLLISPIVAILNNSNL